VRRDAVGAATRHCAFFCALACERDFAPARAEFVAVLVAEAARQADARMSLGGKPSNKQQRIVPPDVIAALPLVGCGGYAAPIEGSLEGFSFERVSARIRDVFCIWW
jgi:hypothetical protein